MLINNNQLEPCKSAKDISDTINWIAELAKEHSGWQTMDPIDLERLKDFGIFFVSRHLAFS